jgi:hypothetical protein
MSGNTKLRKFLLRYYPPGIILQYERDGVMKQKPIDLLDLTPDVDVEASTGPISVSPFDRRPRGGGRSVPGGAWACGRWGF